MQQKLPKWAKSIKPCWNEAILIIFAPKCFVEFSVKSLMPFEVIQKYWKLKEKQFLPLGVVHLSPFKVEVSWVECICLDLTPFQFLMAFSVLNFESWRWNIGETYWLGVEFSTLNSHQLLKHHFWGPLHSNSAPG